ncbi:AAA family ATPase [candidate division WWE3 bacterium]|nr:AAA family ATPase [candidate division WWE3 bacterium]
MSKTIFYLSGMPGTGKTSLVRNLRHYGFEVMDELVDGFPFKVDQNPRSFETAQYIFTQNVKRNSRILESDHEVIIVDRHPIDSLLIAKALLQNELHIRVIEDQYLSFPFLPGTIICLHPHDTYHNQSYLQQLSETDQNLMNDILRVYSNYDHYINAHTHIKNDADSIDSVNEVLDIIRKTLVEEHFYQYPQPSYF